MKVTRRSQITGKTSSMELDVTIDQMELYENGNIKIQDVFPDMDGDKREFIRSGITPAEWNDVFKGLE